MATAHHVRHTSHHSRKSLPAHARPSRPAPQVKRTHSHGSKGSSKATHHKELESEDEEESMAVSFLNYCTVCEKQIIVPSNSVLYCSQSCRKKDTEKSLTYFDHYSPPTTPLTNLSFEDLTFRDIVPQRSPTLHSDSKRSSIAFSDISSDDNTMSDNDTPQPSDSEASRYLRRYQSSSSYANETVRPYRPYYSRASISQVSFGAPSLSHTPASAVSFSMPYTPAYTASQSRPLPPRNPHSSSYSSRSIELVTPMTEPSSPKQYSHKSPATSRMSTSTIEGEIIYAKSPVPSLSAANGSLSRLMASQY